MDTVLTLGFGNYRFGLLWRAGIKKFCFWGWEPRGVWVAWDKYSEGSSERCLELVKHHLFICIYPLLESIYVISRKLQNARSS